MRVTLTILLFIAFNSFAETKEEIIMKIRLATSDEFFADVLQAMAEVESNYNPRAIGDKDQKGHSYGLFQVKWDTAKMLKCAKDIKDLRTIDTNIMCAKRYYEWIYWQLGGNPNTRDYRTMRAYNMGIAGQNKNPYNGKWEHQKYVGKILKVMKRLKKERNKNDNCSME